tara:strand:- start:237 stop:890 length:654 start_codon:yes stop_codon:yes gene_type:complete
MSELRLTTLKHESATADNITLASNGNVGIGNSSPTQKLDVTGTIKATSFVGDGSGLTGVSAGKVLQVVSTTKTNRFTTTSVSYVAITGLSVTITPSSTSSKVLVSFDLNAGIGGAAGGLRIYRGETAIAIGDAISEPANNRMTANLYNGGDDTNSTPNCAMSILDAPNTTSATTYTLRVGCVQSSGTIVVNDQTSQVRNVSYSAVTASTLTVMEIAA